MVQGTGADMSKLAGIYFYRWILANDLWGIVKMCVPLHDEWVVEAPEEIGDQVDKQLESDMIKAGEFFCKKVKIKVDGGVSSAWEH